MSECLSAGWTFPPYRRGQNAKHKPSSVTRSMNAAADREHRPITYEQQLLRNHIDHSELCRQPLLLARSATHYFASNTYPVKEALSQVRVHFCGFTFLLPFRPQLNSLNVLPQNPHIGGQNGLYSILEPYLGIIHVCCFLCTICPVS